MGVMGAQDWIHMNHLVSNLELIGAELAKINNNIEKFLSRTDVRVPDTHITPRPELDVGDCAYCLSPLVDWHRFCSHGSICAACAPCDECNEAT